MSCATIPTTPTWPNRDRFVLSVGPRLDAALRPAVPRGRQSDRRGAEPLDRPGGLPRRHRSSSASSAARRPAIPNTGITTGVETTTGPLGQGCGNSVGMAMARALARAALQQARLRQSSTTTSTRCAGDGDMMEGVTSEAASLAGHLQAGQPVLDLRQQPDHHRGQHRARLQRGRGRALRRLWLARRSTSATPTTPRRSRAALKQLRASHRPPELIRRPQPSSATARRTSTAPARRMASRSARTRSRPPSSAYGWPEDAQFLFPDGVPNIFDEGHRSRAAASCAREWHELHARATAKEYPDLAARARPDADGASCPKAGTADIPIFPADAKGIATPRQLAARC